MHTQDTQTAFINGFRNAAPYIHAHRGHCFVIALSGASLAHPNFKNIVHDIAVLHSLGIRLVLVYGFRYQVERALEKAQIKSQYHQGLRITNSDTLDTIEQVAGQLRIKIEATFSQSLQNSPLRNSDFNLFSGNLVNATPMGILDGVDMQHTGRVRKIDSATLQQNIQLNQVALVSTLAYSSTGEIFNLSLGELAKKTALSIHADKLIIFSHDDGLMERSGQLIRYINSKSSAQRELKSSIKQTQQKLCNNLIDAVNQGIKRAHVLNYQQDGALLKELFTHLGTGTLISQEDYELIRNAEPDDINAIISLIEPFEERGILIKRPRHLLEAEIEHFTLIECDQRIVGCAALYPYMSEPQPAQEPATNAENTSSSTQLTACAEIACIVTHPEYQKKGLASHLLNIMQEKARELDCQRVFVLSTQTMHWFREHGFILGSIDDLPHRKQDLYNYSRKSQVLYKDL